MRYFIAAIFLLSGFFLQAQEHDARDKLPVFKQVTHPFMPPITSEYFFISADGLIWFSTSQGLTSFDGSDIIYHSSLPETNSFGLTRVLAIAEDKNHNFYIGTPAGFFYFNRRMGAYTKLSYTYQDDQKELSPAIYTLYIDNNSIVYGGCGNGGMFIYEPLKKQMRHYNLDASKADSWQDRQFNTVISFAAHATDSNKLWVGTYHGIFLYDKNKKSFYQDFEIISDITHKFSPYFNNDKKRIDVKYMEVENDSIIWFNSYAGGFAKYNSQTGKATIVFGRDALYKAKDIYYGYIISKFVKLSTGKYLLGIYNGSTAVFDTKTNTAAYFSVTGTDYPEEETRYMTSDRHGNTWLLQRGFLYISIPERLRLQSINVPDLTVFSFQKPKIRGIYFDTASHLFYAGFLGSTGIHLYDTNFSLKTVIPTTAINNYFNYGASIDNAITKDGSGRFWITGWENHVMLPGNKKFELTEKQFPSLSWLKGNGKFTDIATTSFGNILVKKDDGTIFHINQHTLAADTIRCPVINNEGVTIKNAADWYDNKRNMIYLIPKEGIAQYNIDKQQMRIIPAYSLFGNNKPGQDICAPALDAEGRLWLMLPRYGIRIIDPVSLNCIDSIQYGTKGLMPGDYTAITGGSGQYILLRSLSGIVVYDYRKKQSFLFDHSNGLPSPDNKALLYSNGYLFISHSGRFEYFKLSNLDNYSSSVVPYLNTVIADATTVFTRTGFEKEQAIKLLHDQNTLTFSFSAPEFYFPERIEYAYQLTPLENTWHYTDYFNRKIIYTKLEPGTYTFLLKSQIQGGNWESKPVSYTIIIEPAWWQTVWFKMISLALIIVSAVYLVRRRIQFIKKSEQQKAKHEKELLELESRALRAQMNPHFIFNCLNSIKSLIQQNENEKSVTYLTTFSKLIRTLFNNADKKEISLYDEIETCKYYLQLEAMRFDTRFSFEVKVEDSIDLKSVQVPALIIQPFIENAIWHGIVPGGNGGHVLLEVSSNNGCIEIVIDDNGIGRASSYNNKPASSFGHQSKGVNLTQSRLELNNLLQHREAKLEIIDKEDQLGKATGTKVIITIKEEQT